MVTVGYGDIAPKTENERLFTLFMSIVGCGLYGYALNGIA